MDDPPPVTVEMAAMFALVPADAPEEWWQDERLGIGSCPYHSYPAGYPIDKNPCPFQACSALVANNPADLYRAAWSELLSASPDIPRRALWLQLIRRWRVERIELGGVRIAWLQEEGSASGGEPQIRRDGRDRQGVCLSWEKLRETVRSEFAAIAIVGGDPEGLGLAARAIVFKVPFDHLTKRLGAVSSEPIATGRITRLPRLRLGNRLLIAKLLGWPPRRSRLRDSLHFRLTMLRANRRKTVRERRQRRQARHSARREMIRRELGLDEVDPTKRASIRRELIGSFREAIGLLTGLAEAIIEIAKATRGLAIALVLAPAGVLAVIARLLLG
ncbi:MAG TPA: hypothetical protein VHR18_02855 [Solirubrobacterales bacterium]|nr:hypothetical protein [Solirubrobacterales bacterium]